MRAKVSILIIGAFLIGPAVNAAGEFDLAMQFPSPQTSTMNTGIEDPEYMSAVFQPMPPYVYAGGRMLQIAWYDDSVYRQTFVAIVGVQIPNDIPGFATVAEAVNADVRIRISDTDGVPFAECLLTTEPAVFRTGTIFFTVDLEAESHQAIANKGTCDIDLETDGIQIGIPVLNHNDLLTTYKKDIETYKLDVEFLAGYCY